MSYLLLFLAGVLVGYITSRTVYWLMHRRHHYVPQLDVYPSAMREHE